MSFDERYLDGSYVERNPTFHVEDASWKARQILAILEKRVLTPKSVAEVGCGAGEILVQLAKAMPETSFSGFELSPQGYEMCREREGERTRYFNADFLEGEDKEFDLVLCIDVFEHVEDYYSFLRNLRRRGKAFVFHIPLDMNTQMVARKNAISSVREAVGHLHYFSTDTALAALQECGYSVDTWSYTPSGSERPSSLKQRLLKIPRQLSFKINKDLTVRLMGGYSLIVYATDASA
jgi:ubiquinone/menaquinone biosynthesis C-methylase UbiE